MSITGSLTTRDVTPTLSVLGKQLLASYLLRVLTVLLQISNRYLDLECLVGTYLAPFDRTYG
jgi:hypothetical protein